MGETPESLSCPSCALCSPANVGAGHAHPTCQDSAHRRCSPAGGRVPAGAQEAELVQEAHLAHSPGSKRRFAGQALISGKNIPPQLIQRPSGPLQGAGQGQGKRDAAGREHQCRPFTKAPLHVHASQCRYQVQRPKEAIRFRPREGASRRAGFCLFVRVFTYTGKEVLP